MHNLNRQQIMSRGAPPEIENPATRAGRPDTMTGQFGHAELLAAKRALGFAQSGFQSVRHDLREVPHIRNRRWGDDLCIVR